MATKEKHSPWVRNETRLVIGCGDPSTCWRSSNLLIFSERTRTGAFRLIWPKASEILTKLIINNGLQKCLIGSPKYFSLYGFDTTLDLTSLLLRKGFKHCDFCVTCLNICMNMKMIARTAVDSHNWCAVSLPCATTCTVRNSAVA